MAKPKIKDAKKTKDKKTSAKVVKAKLKLPEKKKMPTKSKNMNTDQLVADNLAALARATRLNGENVAMLIEKIESIANHVVAIEEMLSEVIAVTGIDIVRVNRRIRERVAAGTDNLGDPAKAIDVAAELVSTFSRSRFA